MREKIIMIHESEDGCRTELSRSYNDDIELDIWELQAMFEMFLQGQGYTQKSINDILKNDKVIGIENSLEERIKALEESIQDTMQELQFAYENFS